MKSNQQASRRVGTMTLGIALICTGILICVALFFPVQEIISLFRFSPLFLTLFGVEVLVCSARAHEEKMRYDWVSMVLCIGIVTAVTGLCAIQLGY